MENEEEKQDNGRWTCGFRTVHVYTRVYTRVYTCVTCVSVSFSREVLGVCSSPKGERRRLRAVSEPGKTFGSVSKPALFFLPLPIDIREAV